MAVGLTAPLDDRDSSAADAERAGALTHVHGLRVKRNQRVRPFSPVRTDLNQSQIKECSAAQIRRQTRFERRKEGGAANEAQW